MKHPPPQAKELIEYDPIAGGKGQVQRVAPHPEALGGDGVDGEALVPWERQLAGDLAGVDGGIGALVPQRATAL